MKIITTSDTFGVLPEIEESSDIFIHCGNFCPVLEKHQSLETQVRWLNEEFVPWLDKVPAEFKIIMPGNRDLAVEYLEPNFQYHIGAIFLKDQAATINKLVFYGIPWTPYAVKRDGEVKLYSARNEKIYQSILDKIPEQTNVLLTRTSPLGILDKIDGVSIISVLAE
jgi:hypothetical protein